jgi:hypothetical protein
VLRGLLPVCAWCKKVREDDGYWSELDRYIASHTEASVSHGICPACTERVEAEAVVHLAADRGPDSDNH